MLYAENCLFQWADKCCNLIAKLENGINSLLKNLFTYLHEKENGKVTIYFSVPQQKEIQRFRFCYEGINNYRIFIF